MLSLAPSPAVGAMDGEFAHPCFGRRPVAEANVAFLVFQTIFSESDGCQILHGAATWCLLLLRTVEASVGMLYGVFCIDLYALSYVGPIDVVVWQCEVDLLDSQRCQTLHISA